MSALPATGAINPHPSSLFIRLRDRLAASDPAFSRLRLASRGLLSLLLSIGLLIGLAQLHGLPPAAYGLGAVIAFTGSTAVRDGGSRAQLITRAYALVASVVAVLVASLVTPFPIVADLTFLVVIFVAVYIRSHGVRGFAICMIAFMSYFIADYLRALPGDIGWLALSGAIAVAVTQFVANVLLRDDPERDFRRALITIDQRIQLIVRHLQEERRRGHTTGIDREPLREHLSRLRDTILMAEGFIPQGEEGSLAAEGRASDLAIALFELQLVVERFVRASFIVLPPEQLIEAVLDHNAAAAVRVEQQFTSASEAETVSTHLLTRLSHARAKLAAALGERPSPAFAAVEKTAKATTAPLPATKQQGLRIPTNLRLPIQVTLACAIAMGGGLLLSPARWYWAVITAFIVFNNTKSRADTALRALQRSGGTFAGLIGGTAIATLLHGQLIASAVAIPILFFFALYFLQVSYGVMIFFITLGLALLYGVMGSFTPELLLLRLEETVIGSLAGTLVAFLVFPARASLGAAAALDKYLRALADLIAAARRRAHGEPEPQHLLGRSRLLDRSYTELANAVRPLGGPWGAVTRFGEVRERLLLLTGCAHWGRVLARGIRPGDVLAPATIERFDELADEVSTRIAKAESMRDWFFERPEVAEGTATPATPRPPLPISEDENPTFALEVISALLERAMLAGHGAP